MKVIYLTIMCLLLSVALSYAVGDATKYEVTVQGMQIRKTDGSWKDLQVPQTAIDIASVNAGATAGQMLNATTIDPGSYDNFRLILSNVMVAAGADGANSTNTGGQLTLTATTANGASSATWANDGNGNGLPTANPAEPSETHKAGAANPGDITVTLNLGAAGGRNDGQIYIQRQNPLGSPITILPTSTVSFAFSFDTLSTIYHQDVGGGPADIMYIVPPAGGTSFSITVDGVTTTVAAGQMELEF